MQAAAKATQTVRKPPRKTDRKARPAIVAIADTAPCKAPQPVRAVPILGTRLEEFDRKTNIQGSLGGELLAQCEAAGIPMTTAFAYDVMEAPARLVALLSKCTVLMEACMKMIDTHVLNVPTGRAVTELSMLLEERRGGHGGLGFDLRRRGPDHGACGALSRACRTDYQLSGPEWCRAGRQALHGDRRPERGRGRRLGAAHPRFVPQRFLLAAGSPSSRLRPGFHRNLLTHWGT